MLFKHIKWYHERHGVWSKKQVKKSYFIKAQHYLNDRFCDCNLGCGREWWAGGIIFILLFCIDQVSNSQNPVFFSYPVANEINLRVTVSREREREREKGRKVVKRERNAKSEWLFFLLYLLRAPIHRQLWREDTPMLKLWGKILRLMREYFFSAIYLLKY